MSLIFMEGFDHTAKSRDKWEIVGYNTKPTKVLGRFGGEAIQRPTGVEHNYMGKVFGSQTDCFMGCAVFFPSFNASDDSMFKFGIEHEYTTVEQAELDMITAVNTTHAQASVKSDGSIKLDVNALTITSSAGVLTVNTWHYIEFRIFPDAASGVFQCKVDGVTVATINGDTSQPSGETIEAVYIMSDLVTSSAILYDDLYICNALGSVNNTYLGDTRVDIMLPDTTGVVDAVLDAAIWNSTSARANKWQDLDNNPSLYYTTPTVDVFMTGKASAGAKPAYDTYQAQSYADLGFTPGTIHGVQLDALVRYAVSLIGSSKWEVKMAVIKTDPLNVAIQSTSPTLGEARAEYAYKTAMFETNPHTTIAWTDTELTNHYTGIVGDQ